MMPDLFHLEIARGEKIPVPEDVAQAARVLRRWAAENGPHPYLKLRARAFFGLVRPTVVVRLRHVVPLFNWVARQLVDAPEQSGALPPEFSADE